MLRVAMLCLFVALACSSDPSGKPSASAGADASSGGSHAMSTGTPGSRDGGGDKTDARVAVGGNGGRGSAASDAAVTTRDADVAPDEDAATEPAMQADAGTAPYHLCAFKDACGMRQGDQCPAVPAGGSCSKAGSCFYCSRLATNADLEVICTGSHWMDSTPMACRP